MKFIQFSIHTYENFLPHCIWYTLHKSVLKDIDYLLRSFTDILHLSFKNIFYIADFFYK